MTVKVGVIGCGGIANGKHLPSLAKISEVSMVAFCDIDKTKAESAARRYGDKNVTVYEDYIELLKDNSIEVIHVCTRVTKGSPTIPLSIAFFAVIAASVKR